MEWFVVGVALVIGPALAYHVGWHRGFSIAERTIEDAMVGEVARTWLRENGHGDE